MNDSGVGAMGYDLHITRKNPWWEPKGPEISLAEWLAFVASDPEMRLDGYAETRMPSGKVLRMEREGLAVWTAYSQHDENGNKAWFLYHRGEIALKNPDEEIIRKMWTIAQALSATLQGDEGETYDSAANYTPPSEPGRRSWWKFW